MVITALSWMGWRDAENANNEFVELTLDYRVWPRPTFDLTGFSLRNNAGEAFWFPAGFAVSRRA